MRKKAFYILIVVIILSSLGTAVAAELPIDIEAIGQQAGYDDAITAWFNVDLFSAKAEAVSEAIAEQTRQSRETASSSLFQTGHINDAVDTQEQISNVTEDFALFSKPVNYSGMSMASGGAGLSVWLIAVIFAVCGIGGFVLAYALAARKRRKKSDVH